MTNNDEEKSVSESASGTEAIVPTNSEEHYEAWKPHPVKRNGWRPAALNWLNFTG